MMFAVFMAAMMTSPSALAQESTDKEAARAAAEQWLNLVDSGDTSGAWRASSVSVRDKTNQFFYTSIIGVSRMTLGELKSRTLKGSGVKGKDQLTFEYESRFEKDAKVSETVTAVHDKDGNWRVSGYNVSAN